MTHTARVWRTLPRYRQCFVVPGLEGTSVGSDSRCLAPPDYYRLANFNANLDALAPAGIIQLQHDLLQSSVDAVSSFISSARAKGYSFVSIDRCIHGPNFQRNPSWVRCAPSPKGGEFAHLLSKQNCTNVAVNVVVTLSHCSICCISASLSFSFSLLPFH